MAVELRCPECRAKLRLSEPPEPDTEIECPKCGTAFPAEDNRVLAGAEDEQEAAKKKAQAESKPEPNKDAKKEAKPFKRKKRRGKKKKTNPTLLYGILGGGVLAGTFLIVMLVWMFGRKTPTQEMMSYLPDDCDIVYGVNMRYMKNYPEFYKACENFVTGTGFYSAAEAFTKASGADIEMVMQGEGKSGEVPVEATVFRTKAEFDPASLAKLPGAKEYAANGVKYYTIDDIPALKYEGVKAFAPTNRIVVFARSSISESTFNSMLTGNKANPEKGIYSRAGPLVKAVTRGTAWKLVLYGPNVPKPQKPEGKSAGQGAGSEDDFQKEIVEILTPAQGFGIKASIGSREVRGEWVVWFKDSETASSQAKKWRDKDWVKDDEKTPPLWWKTVASKSGGGKTAENALKDGLAFKSSGELFIVRSALETKVLQGGIATLINWTTGVQKSGGMGAPGRPGGGPGGGPGPISGPSVSGGGPGGPGGSGRPPAAGPGGAPGRPPGPGPGPKQ